MLGLAGVVCKVIGRGAVRVACVFLAGVLGVVLEAYVVVGVFD